MQAVLLDTGARSQRTRSRCNAAALRQATQCSYLVVLSAECRIQTASYRDPALQLCIAVLLLRASPTYPLVTSTVICLPRESAPRRSTFRPNQRLSTASLCSFMVGNECFAIKERVIKHLHIVAEVVVRLLSEVYFAILYARLAFLALIRVFAKNI